MKELKGKTITITLRTTALNKRFTRKALESAIAALVLVGDEQIKIDRVLVDDHETVPRSTRTKTKRVK